MSRSVSSLFTKRWMKDRIEKIQRIQSEIRSEGLDIDKLGLGYSIDETYFAYPKNIPTTDEDVLNYLIELEETAKEVRALFNFVAKEHGFKGKLEVKTDEDWNTQKIAIKLTD